MKRYKESSRAEITVLLASFGVHRARTCLRRRGARGGSGVAALWFYSSYTTIPEWTLYSESLREEGGQKRTAVCNWFWVSWSLKLIFRNHRPKRKNKMKVCFTGGRETKCSKTRWEFESFFFFKQDCLWTNCSLFNLGEKRLAWNAKKNDLQVRRLGR